MLWLSRRYIRRDEAAKLVLPLVEKAQLLDAAIELIHARDAQISRDQGHIEELMRTNTFLEQRVQALETPIKLASVPLYASETEEDFQWQLDNNMINREEFTSLMKQLEFDNAGLTLDYESY